MTLHLVLRDNRPHTRNSRDQRAVQERSDGHTLYVFHCWYWYLPKPAKPKLSSRPTSRPELLDAMVKESSFTKVKNMKISRFASDPTSYTICNTQNCLVFVAHTLDIRSNILLVLPCHASTNRARANPLARPTP